MSTVKDKDFNTLIKNFGRGVFYLEEILQRGRKVYGFYIGLMCEKRKVGRS